MKEFYLRSFIVFFDTKIHKQMLQSKFWYFFCMLFFCDTSFSSAQVADSTGIESYYQLPTQRGRQEEMASFPNLKYSKIQYYFRLLGGFRKAYIDSDGFEIVSPTTPLYINSFINGLYGLRFGLDRNQNHYFEIGYQYFVNQLSHTISAYAVNGIYMNSNQAIHSMPLEYKKRIFYFDKIARTAQINLCFGTLLSLGEKRRDQGFNNLLLPPNSAYSSIKRERSLGYPVASLDYGFEILGKLAERFEIGVFIKGHYLPNKRLSQTITWNLKNGSSNSARSDLGAQSIAFGLSFYIKAPPFKVYTSKLNDRTIEK
jgi:hypothetical protein